MMNFVAFNSFYAEAFLQVTSTSRLILQSGVRIVQIEVRERERVVVRHNILKLLENWRIFVTCCIGQTDLAFQE
jgi:hypothetical protein